MITSDDGLIRVPKEYSTLPVPWERGHAATIRVDCSIRLTTYLGHDGHHHLFRDDGPWTPLRRRR